LEESAIAGMKSPLHSKCWDEVTSWAVVHSELTVVCLGSCQIANSLTEQRGPQDFPDFWGLGGLRANRKLRMTFRPGAVK
jgi:hypothetical protein